MLSFIRKFMLFLLLVLPATMLLSSHGSVVAKAEDDGDHIEDVMEGEEDADIEEEEEEEDEDADVEVEEEEEEEDAGEEVGTGEGVVEAGEEEEEDEEEEALKPSPDAETTLLFTKNNEQEIPVTIPVQVLVGFANNGQQDFYLNSIHASLRYPQDFSYHVYNFSAEELHTVVSAGGEATVEYVFLASEVFASRPFGMVIELAYKDSDGNAYSDAVFNETIKMVELDEGMDTETFFLYVFLGAVLILLLVGAQQLLSSFGRKKKSSKRHVETGTRNQNGVDLDWIPKENISFKKSPSPRRSPRRRTTRNAGSGDE